MKEIERIITSHEEAIKDGWIDVKESDEDWNDFVKLVEYTRSTLTPPDINDQENDPEFLKRVISRLAYENEKLINNGGAKYHHDRILKAKDAEIAELKAYIEARGFDKI